MTTDSEEQQDELLVLTEILGPALTTCKDPEGRNRGKLLIDVRINESVRVVASPDKEFSVQHLPPVSLEFSLPPAYPSTCPPSFKLSSDWLYAAQISTVETQLKDLWSLQEGTVILFQWLNFLQEELSEFLSLEAIGVDVVSLINSKASVL